MAALLFAATCGGFLRYYAADPSTLRDVGTLLLVLWLPAVGNLVAYLIGKLPRRAARVTDFATGSSFTPHLQVDVVGTGIPSVLLDAISPTDPRCTLVVKRNGYSARLNQPVAQTLAIAGQRFLTLELLHPAVALDALREDTEFHLLVATTAVGKGRVVAQPAVWPSSYPTAV